MYTASEQIASLHDRQAPYWAAVLAVMCATGLATIWIDGGTFWKGYVLDMVGPAWNYVLIRGRFTERKDNHWTRFFKPTTTFALFILVCFTIEGAQYLELYDSTYDPWDFLAYISLMTPLYMLDLWGFRKESRIADLETPGEL